MVTVRQTSINIEIKCWQQPSSTFFCPFIKRSGCTFHPRLCARSPNIHQSAVLPCYLCWLYLRHKRREMERDGGIEHLELGRPKLLHTQEQELWKQRGDIFKNIVDSTPSLLIKRDNCTYLHTGLELVTLQTAAATLLPDLFTLTSPRSACRIWPQQWVFPRNGSAEWILITIYCFS